MKSYLRYENQELTFGLKQSRLFSFCKDYKKPTYIYDLGIIKERVELMQMHLKSTKIFYAMKANANKDILKFLKTLNIGIDVVSSGEIVRAIDCGFTGQDMVFSGVGKTIQEIEFAIDQQIYQINVESYPELVRISEIAGAKNKTVAVALRVNPNIEIDTHPYIATGLHENKFGIDQENLDICLQYLEKNKDTLKFQGVSLHLGSQMTDLSGFKDALKLLKPEFVKMKNRFPELKAFDFGGGLGVHYHQSDLAKEENLLIEYSKIVFDELGDLDCELQSEPGRWIMAHAGVLLMQCQYIKETPNKKFLIVDSGMSHLMRPTLYQAYHEIYPLKRHRDRLTEQYDVVGPICESSDFFAKNRSIEECKQGDFLVVADVGAYGYSMSSDYNLKEKPVEIVLGST